MKYIALVKSLEERIAKRDLAPGDRLPAQRQLAEDYGVTVATVTRAIAEAARRGLVTAKRGSGTYVREPDQNAASSGEVIDLSVNTPTTAIVDDLLESLLQDSHVQRNLESMFGYSSYPGWTDLRENGVRWIRKFGPDVRADTVFPTHGVHHGLMAAFGAFASAGDAVACEALAYTGVKRIADYRNVRLAGVPVDDDGIVPAALDDEIRRSRAKVAVITTVTQNPTTATLSPERCAEIAEIARRHDLVLIEDAVNAPLAGESVPVIASLAPERTVYLTGLSKCVAPGLRLGYAAVPKQLLGPFHDALVSTHWIAPSLCEHLVGKLLSDNLIERFLERHRREALARTRIAQELLDVRTSSNLPSYHAWINVPEGFLADDFCSEAVRAGVRVSPASHFAVASTADMPEAYRISLGACASREEVRTGLEVLAAILRRRPATFGTVA